MKTVYMRFPGGKKKALTLSYDDGVEQDIRLIEIMKKYGLKGTFNINSGMYASEDVVYEPGTIHRRMSKNAVTKLYKNSGMEVAAHGLTHPVLIQLPANFCNRDIYEDRKNLEEQFGTFVRGYAYPFGLYNDSVIKALECNGIVYARTVNSTEQFFMPDNWLTLNPTCHHDNPKLMELAKFFAEFNLAWDPWMFYLWGHSYEFEQNDNWEVIERFAEYMGNREDIWYATNMEIYEYVQAYGSLIFSMDGNIVKNPTSYEIFVQVDEELVCIKAGETLCLNNA